jgi:hypothetical protein
MVVGVTLETGWALGVSLLVAFPALPEPTKQESYLPLLPNRLGMPTTPEALGLLRWELAIHEDPKCPGSRMIRAMRDGLAGDGLAVGDDVGVGGAFHRSFPTLTSLPKSPGGCGAPHGAFFGVSQGRHGNHLQAVGLVTP